MNMKWKNILVVLAGIAIGAFVLVSIFKNPLEHIEDTNGAENFTLQTITDENICKMDLGALNVNKHEALVGDTVTYDSDCFTGVYEIYTANRITNRFEITVNHATVNAGNFKMVLCLDNEIVHTFTLNELTQTFVLEDVAGTISLRIAGESAEFSFDYYVN